MISSDLLIRYNAQLKEYKQGDLLFKQNETPRHYFQLDRGEVKLCNINSEGKEFIQSIFSEGKGVGEPALLGGYNYPANCIALKESKVWLLPKKSFLSLLEENKNVLFEVSKVISKRLHYKAIISSEISIENPEHKIITLIDYLKHDIYKINKPFEYQVELSRQQIADLIGLRVETVIRTIKKLEAKNKIKLIKHKIFR
jgi:CRP-like cAMP-binding protein